LIRSYRIKGFAGLQDYRITGFLLSVTLIHMINGFAETEIMQMKVGWA